jgi:DNA-binding NarL/FixJ family response regulator
MSSHTEHLKRVTAKSRVLARALEDRDVAVVVALRAGLSLREVAKAADLSPEGVRKISLRRD